MSQCKMCAPLCLSSLFLPVCTTAWLLSSLPAVAMVDTLGLLLSEVSQCNMEALPIVLQSYTFPMSQCKICAPTIPILLLLTCLHHSMAPF